MLVFAGDREIKSEKQGAMSKHCTPRKIEVARS